MAAVVRQTIEGAGGKRPVWDIRTMDDYVAAAMAETKFVLILLGVLSGVAFILSMIGVYGVVSYSIAERMHEFAIRIAIGAQSRDILKLALAGGIAPAIIGVAIGLTGAFTLGGFLRAMLFNVSPTDGLTYVVAAATIVGAALVASYLAVRGVTRADPREYLQ
jgi:putative ABC transport system permease protein